MKHLYLIILSILISVSANALDLRKILSLNGTWKFNVGDNLEWAEKDFNDSEWDKIPVPGLWEDNGYVGYNGYAWYRRSFVLKNIGDHNMLYLVIRAIDDADEVYLNGNKIGCLGSFPPNFETAYNYIRTYVIPRKMLEEKNVLAVRVYDRHKGGGIKRDVKLCVDQDEVRLDLDLSGNWKFKTGHNKEQKRSDFNDSGWEEIHVPQAWEYQGYEKYDGYAWYRKSFTIPSELRRENLVLVLGKIDDTDMVYFNGKLIGTSISKKGKNDWDDNSRAWLKNRVYKIPKDLIQDRNVISVAVYDMRGPGGIYLGPIGIMTDKNYYQSRMYRDKGNNGDDFWEHFLKELFD